MREPHKLEPHDLRYAEGKREADECRCCGQAIWRVYHGPNRNHTVEPRAGAAREIDLRPWLIESINDWLSVDPERRMRITMLDVRSLALSLSIRLRDDAA